MPAAAQRGGMAAVGVAQIRAQAAPITLFRRLSTSGSI